MKKYSIGLDIGTTSVGWAVIDSTNFKVIRKGNKYLWGVRLFEEATTAEKRRQARGTRRRYDRRRERIKLLQEEFKDEINKVDKDFYQKLKETFFNAEDTTNKTITITKEENELVKKYYQKYPTIYHLRKRLIDDPNKCDIRLVYLAIHHIIKYRGNFLYGNSKIKINNIDITEKLEELFNDIQNSSEIENSFNELTNIDYEALKTALYTVSKNDKKLLLENELTKNINKKSAKELVKLFVGDKFSINTLFCKDNPEDIKISFKGSEYDDNYSNICNLIPSEIETLECLKEIYDIVFLKTIFAGTNAPNISSLMVERYAHHKNDLQELKKLLRENKIILKKVFKTKDEKNVCLYDSYIHNKVTYDDFTKAIIKYISDLNDNILPEKLILLSNKIKEKIDNGTFLPRITDIDNGKFPYQINEEELNIIIKNQSTYYPFLLNTANDDTPKIIKLLRFRIPYYVGPLNNTTLNKDIKNPNSWFVRQKENVKITPYNFNEVVDLEASAEIFIKRMLGHCTYLLKEPAMPNNSILYSKFKVLNELKQIKVGELGREERLTHKAQQDIYNNLFLKTTGTITDKKFKEYLKNQKEFEMYKENFSVIGYSSDNKFANNMGPYIDFFGEDGFFQNTEYTIADAEEIINLMTIFEDKEILKRKLQKEYLKLNDTALKRICSKKYKGWSALSKKLLTEVYYKDKKTSENKNIINLMENTPENFMQIINNDEYNFNRKIAEYNKTSNSKKISYDVIEELVTSPANKRGIFQAIKVIEEIISYIGYEPDTITVEMARGDELKARKDDRKKQLEKLYEANKKTISEYDKLKKELSSQEKIDTEKLFLYFIQEGKSLYSGTTLDINKLNEYEIDHIIPRTLIKDNSIDNKALVLRNENQIKAANFVLPEQFRTIKMKGWWQHLKKVGLISTKKYNNLSRYKYDEKSISGFINRQLVETRQICKHVANIISNYHQDTKVNHIPASLSHNYREKFKLYKFREINDYHHAHDAYLAAALGIYKNKYLKKNIDYQELKDFTKKLYDEKRYSEIKDGYVINSLDPELEDINIFNFINEETGELLFDIEKFNQTVKDTLFRNDILISKKVEFRTGEYFNQTKLKKGGKGIRLRENLPTESYGSYSSLNPAYAIVVKYTKKNKEEQKMIGIPIVIVEKSKKDGNYIIEYVKNILKLSENDNIEIIKDRIPFYSLLNWNNQLCYLVGATDRVEVCNGTEFHIPKGLMQKWQNTFIRLFKNKPKIIDDNTYNIELIEIIEYIKYNIKKNYKLYSNLLDQINDMFSTDVLSRIESDKKEKIIIEMLKLLKIDSQNANLKFLNNKYSMAFGKKNDRTIPTAIIINKSVTGIWENKDEF